MDKCSIFPIKTWNVHDTILKNEACTDNIADGWNNRFKNLVGVIHQSIWALLKKLQLKLAADETRLQDKASIKKTNIIRSKIN